MEHTISKTILITQTIELIAKKYKLTIEEARNRLYESDVMRMLNDDETGLYGGSALYLLSLYENKLNKKKDLFEFWLDKKDTSNWVKRALFCKSYKTIIEKYRKEYIKVDNEQFDTLGDAVIKLCYCEILLDKVNNITEEKKKYESDYYLVTRVAKHYDLLKYLDFNIEDPNIPQDYNYNPSKPHDSNPHKYIADTVEAMVGAIYMETKNLDAIKELLKSWMDL